MLIIALCVALMLDASPKLDLPVLVPPREAERPKSQPAPSLSVAVTLECTARANGRVEDCRVLGETHPGLGFGEAAVALMQDATVDPSPQDFQFARTIQFTP